MTSARKLLVVFMVGLVAVQASVGVAMAQNQTVNWGSDAAHENYVYEDYATIAEHDTDAMSSPLDYYDDNGEVQRLPASLNESVDNPTRVRADKIDDVDLRQFPRKTGESNNSVTAIDATEWSKDVSGVATTGASASVTDTQTAGVDAVQLSTSGQASGDTTVFTFSNTTVDGDVAKRVAMLVGSVDTLDSGASVHVRANEADGDYREVNISSAANAADVDVAANSTAQGFIYQQKLNELGLKGSGDGSHDSIDSISVVVSDADAQLTITGMDYERKTQLTFGKTTTADGSTEAIKNDYDGGVLELESLDTMGSWADGATLNDLQVHGIEYRASDAPSDRVSAEVGEAPNYAMSHKVDQEQRLYVPAAIDVEHHGLSLRVEQSLVSDRYKTYRYAEGVGEDKTVENVSDSSWKGATGDLSSVGDTLTHDTTIQPGQYILIDLTATLNDEQANNYMGSSGGSGTGAKSSGGIGSIPVIGTLFVVVMGLLRKVKG